MSSKIRETIIQGILRNENEKKRDPWNSVDKLDFLVDEIDKSKTIHAPLGPIILKNSWSKKIGNYLMLALLLSFIIYLSLTNLDLSKIWSWVIIAVLTYATILLYIDVFNNKIIIKIDNNGLTINNKNNTWESIEYLHFKTEYNGDGDFRGTYLIMTLKDGTEDSIIISDLKWTSEKLGRILYSYMKKFNSH